MSTDDYTPHEPPSTQQIVVSEDEVLSTSSAAGPPVGSNNDTIVPTKLVNLKMPKTLKNRRETRLYEGYEPQPFDVICTRHKESSLHSGNIRFRLCVEMRLERYVAAKTRRDKTKIVKEIIDAVRESGGRFVRQYDVISDDKNDTCDAALSYNSEHKSKQQGEGNINRRLFFDVGNKKAADKISHALRFAAATKGYDVRRNSWSPDSPTPNEKHGKSPTVPTLHFRNNLVFSMAHDKRRYPVEQEYSEFDPGYKMEIANTKAAIRSNDAKRQTWHAGASCEAKERSRLAIMLDDHSTVSDASLSSTAWDLNILQNIADEDDDECSFGSLGSLSLAITEGSILEKGQVIANLDETEDHFDWDDI